MSKESIKTPTVLNGNIISITIHDEDMAEDSLTVTNILQGIANNMQSQKIKAEDILFNLELRKKNKFEQIFADKLSAQIKTIDSTYIDLYKFWDIYNQNPHYKLLPQTNDERRITNAKQPF